MIEQLPDALPRGGRNRIDLHIRIRRIQVGPDPCHRIELGILHFLPGYQVHLVGGNDLAFLRQIHIITCQFLIDRDDILNGIPAFAAGSVHHMDQDLGPFDMGQEFMSQAQAFRGPFDQAGNIRHDETARSVQVHNAQDGRQGREMIVGDLGPGVGHHGQQGGFSNVGKSDQTYVRNDLELQQEFQGLGRLAGLGVFGRLHGRCGVVHVAVAAPAAFEQEKTAVLTGHIRDDLAGRQLPDNGALRHFQDQVLSPFARAAFLFAVFAVLGFVFADMPEIHQGIQAFIYLQIDTAAVTAVTPVRTAGRNEFFPAEGYVSVSPFAAADNYLCFIFKHGFSFLMNSLLMNSLCFMNVNTGRSSLRVTKKASDRPVPV